MAWYDSGWKYRKSMILSRPSGGITNYQMKLLVADTSSATDENVDCNGHCLASFSDLRFTKADGTTLLDYWVESVSCLTPNQIATVWVKLDSIGTTDTTFYMYYGNSGASSVSNGINTFTFFDDFDGSSIDTNKWYHWMSNGSYTIGNSNLSITGGADVYEAWGCKYQYGQGYAFKSKVKINNDIATPGIDVCIFGIDDRSATGSHTGTGVDGAIIQNAPSNIYLNKKENNATSSNRSDALTNYSILDIIVDGTNGVKYSVNSVEKANITTNEPQDDCGIIFYSNSSSRTVTIDWALVRKWYATEPSWGTWGAEETRTKIYLPFRGKSRFLNYDL